LQTKNEQFEKDYVCFFHKKKALREKMHRTVPLISPSDELNLIEFLKPYRKMSSDQICNQNVDAPQVTVWTFQGKWKRHEARKRPKNQGSWCQALLTSILGLSESEYKSAKKELFSQGLNGVYKHYSKDLFAIVYRPAARISNSTKAAIAGGLVLAGGLGLAGRHYARQAPSQNATQTPANPTSLKPAPTPTPEPTPNNPDDAMKHLEEYYRNLDDYLAQHFDVDIRQSEVKYLSDYARVINEQGNHGKDVQRYQDQLELFNMIADLKMARIDLNELFMQPFWKIVSNSVFKEARVTVCKYFDHMKDLKRSRTCRAAVNYLQIRQLLDMQLKEGEPNDERLSEIVDNLQQLSSQATRPDDKSPELEAVETLYRTYHNSKPENCKVLRLKLLHDAGLDFLERYEDPVLDPAWKLVRKTMDWFRQHYRSNTVPIISDEFGEMRAEINKLKQDVHFYDEIRRNFAPREESPTIYGDLENVRCLFQRAQALHDLDKSESDLREEIKTWNAAFEDSRHTEPEYNDMYIKFSKIDPNWKLFADSYCRNDAPNDVTTFTLNTAMVERYLGYSKVRTYDLEFQRYILAYMDVHMLNQLKRDLNAGAFKVDQHAQVLENDLIARAKQISGRPNDIRWADANPNNASDARWKGAYVTDLGFSVDQ
jgi:hypothetical protein